MRSDWVLHGGRRNVREPLALTGQAETELGILATPPRGFRRGAKVQAEEPVALKRDASKCHVGAERKENTPRWRRSPEVRSIRKWPARSQPLRWWRRERREHPSDTPNRLVVARERVCEGLDPPWVHLNIVVGEEQKISTRRPNPAVQRRRLPTFRLSNRSQPSIHLCGVACERLAGAIR